jgi:signal transduction histidine kinase/CheY-like chemotaxis protein
MNNNNIIDSYIGKKIQLVETDIKGKVSKKSNNFLTFNKGEYLPEKFPFFESIFSIIDNISSNSLYPCVEFINDAGEKLLLDVTLIKQEKLVTILLTDFTDHYTQSNTLIQEKNESVIANKKLLFEQALFKEKERLTNTFLAKLSHELRSPLSNILGIIGLLQESQKMNYEDAEMLKIASKTGFHMESLLNDLLDISKIKQGELDLKEVPFKMYSVIAFIAELYKLKANNKGLKFIVKIDKDVPKNILGDPIRLKQILVNLTENAIKNTQTGKIKIHVYNKGEKHDKTLVGFDIVDTGKGIKEKDIPDIFKQYYQLENLFNTTQGDGLGLKIVEDLVIKQGGTITVESKQGVGSTFSITIPYKTLSKKPQERKIYKKEDYQGILNVINVLIVDDSEIDLMILTKLLLKQLYFNIDLATGVKQAMARIEKKKPDVLLIDLVLDDEEGYALIRNVKENKETNGIPIIAITARATEEERKKCKKLGVDGFITKPYDKHELITLINRVVRKKD